MDDDKIKEIFSNFDPDMSSSFQFMTKLRKNMEAVEIVKQHNIAIKKRNRIAVTVAALCGFIMGVILTTLFPTICSWASSLSISIPQMHISTITIDVNIVAWMITAGMCVITAISAYDIAMAKLSTKDSLSL
jgi:hypothetical protein